MSLDITTLTGPALAEALPDLAALRIAVFREWPYLYDGGDGYERRYLERFAASPGAVIVAARAGGRAVGAATGAPLGDHDAAFAEPLAAAGLDPEEVFYCAESVLLPEHRGAGAGHAFFDLREAHARALGLRYAAFCAVIRPNNHPRRPRNYRPLDGFWRKRGYAPLDGAIARYGWRDLGDPGETIKPMQVWLRSL